MTAQGDLMAKGREPLETIVIFTKYEMRRVFGRVFWLKTDNTIQVTGVWHDSVNQDQTEVETQAKASICFTTATEIEDFNELSSTQLWITEYRGYLFSPTRRGKYNQVMETYHYYGDSTYSQFKRLFVETTEQLNSLKSFSSNSLLYWLDLDFSIPLYPAFLIPTNLSEPYIVLNIKNSKNLTSGFFINQLGERETSRLDTIKLTVFNADIEQISNILEVINNNGIVNGTFGVCGCFEITDINDLVQSENNTQAICHELNGAISYVSTVKTISNLKQIDNPALTNWVYMPFIEVSDNILSILDINSQFSIIGIDSQLSLINI